MEPFEFDANDERSWERLLAGNLRGHYRYGDGITIAAGVPPKASYHTDAVFAHELIHEQIADNSAFGWLQQVLVRLRASPHAPAEIRQRCQQLFRRTIVNCRHAHEAAATYRSLVWNFFHGDVEALLQSLPKTYRADLDLALAALGHPRDWAPESYSIEAELALHELTHVFGLALFNAPLLEPYAADAGLLDAPVLPWIEERHPDERLQLLAQHPEALREALKETFMPIARGRFADYMTGPALIEAWDAGLAALRRTLPELPLLTFSETKAQTASLWCWLEVWDPDHLWHSAAVQPGRTKGPLDVLYVRHAWLRRSDGSGQGSHELETLPASPVDLSHMKSHLAGAERRAVLHLAWLKEHSLEELRRDPMGATYTLWTVPMDCPTGPNSPVHPSLRCLVTEGRLSALTDELACEELALIWYTNWPFQRMLVERKLRLFRPLLCVHASPGELLAISDLERNQPGVFDWPGHEAALVAVMNASGTAFSFSAATSAQAMVARALIEQIPAKLDPTQTLRLGDAACTNQDLARIASWGFFGR